MLDIPAEKILQAYQKDARHLNEITFIKQHDGNWQVVGQDAEGNWRMASVLPGCALEQTLEETQRPLITDAEVQQKLLAPARKLFNRPEPGPTKQQLFLEKILYFRRLDPHYVQYFLKRLQTDEKFRDAFKQQEISIKKHAGFLSAIFEVENEATITSLVAELTKLGYFEIKNSSIYSYRPFGPLGPLGPLDPLDRSFIKALFRNNTLDNESRLKILFKLPINKDDFFRVISSRLEGPQDSLIKILFTTCLEEFITSFQQCLKTSETNKSIIVMQMLPLQMLKHLKQEYEYSFEKYRVQLIQLCENVFRIKLNEYGHTYRSCQLRTQLKKLDNLIMSNKLLDER